MLPQAGFPGEAGAAVTKAAAAGMPTKAGILLLAQTAAGRMLGATRQRRMQGQVYRWYRQPTATSGPAAAAAALETKGCLGKSLSQRRRCGAELHHRPLQRLMLYRCVRIRQTIVWVGARACLLNLKLQNLEGFLLN